MAPLTFPQPIGCMESGFEGAIFLVIVALYVRGSLKHALSTDKPNFSDIVARVVVPILLVVCSMSIFVA